MKKRKLRRRIAELEAELDREHAARGEVALPIYWPSTSGASTSVRCTCGSAWSTIGCLLHNVTIA